VGLVGYLKRNAGGTLKNVATYYPKAIVISNHRLF